VKVSLETWQVGPDNRWAYQHVDELVATVTVARDPAHSTEPARRDTGLDAIVDDRELDALWVDGIAVVHEDVLLLERYRNNMAPGTLHLSQSVSKSVLALLVGVLAGAGRLDTAAPVADLVPEIASSGYAGATVRHLLDMTAAIDFVEDYAGDFWRYDVACGWHPPVPGADARSILDYLPTIGGDGRRHGEVLHYATPNTDLLGIVAQRAGGAPLAELLSRELWQPMGAEHDALVTVDPAGTAVMGGGLSASLRDYARIGALVAAHGRDVVPAEWIDALGAGDPRAFARRLSPHPAMTGYGRQWWRAGDFLMARGIHGQMIAVDPETRFVAAVVSSWPEAIDPEAAPAQRALVARLRDAVTG
jgi:CubicO group peptidase (beta-lactamase class C family)